MPDMLLETMPRFQVEETPPDRAIRVEESAFRHVFRLLEQIKRWCQ